MSDLLTLARGERGVYTLTIRRPEVRNALNEEAFHQLIAACEQIGSDDGAKAWINGQQVHANDASRGVEVAADKVKVSLKKGWNTLLIKVVNKESGWGVCARFQSVDGKPMNDLRLALNKK